MNNNTKPISKKKVESPLNTNTNSSQITIDNSNKVIDSQNKSESINNQKFLENEIELHRYGHSITLSKYN